MGSNDVADESGNGVDGSEGDADGARVDERTTARGGRPGADESLVDLARRPVVAGWTKFVAAVLALAGFGMGLVLIVLDVVDEDEFEVGGEAGREAVDAGLAALSVLPPLYLSTAVAAVVVGVFFGWTLAEDDRTTTLAAALGSSVGAFALVFLGVTTASVAMDGVSVDFGALVVNGIAAGVAVAVVAAAAVWVARNVAPAGVGAAGSPVD